VNISSVAGAAEEATAELGIPAQDIAEVIAFAVSRPHRVALRTSIAHPAVRRRRVVHPVDRR
jgi:NADP-dependent 3-hydroxy acid dehydrogenase YdfG